MGLLDDLKMGFGLAERTEDYDARTARNIASGEAERAARARGAGDHETMIAGIRARQNYNPSAPSEQGVYYLDRAGAQGGYEAGGYRPAIAEDNRPMFQRMLTSPASDLSPRPYAIGPLTMDGPIELPQFGLLGLFAGGLKNMFQSGDETDATINVAKRVVDRLPRTSTMNTPSIGNGQPETGPEDFSRVDVYNPKTDYIEQDFSNVIPSTTAAQDFVANKDFLDTVQSAIDIAKDTGKAPLSNPNFYDPSGAFGMRTGMSSIIRLPNGRFVDTLTGRYL